MKIIKMSVFALVVILWGIVFTGCSATGWATRDIPDGSGIEAGQMVSVVQKDGNRITGKYIGERDISPSEYFNQYLETLSLASSGKHFPRIGDRVEITTSLSTSRAWSGQLVGFDKQNLWIQLPKDADPTRFYISSLTALSHGDDESIGGLQFRQLYLNGSVPLRTALEIRSDAGNVLVPLNSIAKIVEVPDKNPATTTSIIALGSK